MWLKVIVIFLITEKGLSADIPKFSDKIIFPNLPNVVWPAEDSLCKQHSQLYLDHLSNLTYWAHEMWDASAKATAGVLRGSVFQMGNFDECITIEGPIATQFCFATLKASVEEPNPPRDPLSLYYPPFDSVLHRLYKSEDVSQQARHTIQYGLCIPASCSSSDLEQYLNKYLTNLEHPLIEKNVNYSAKVAPAMCQSKSNMRNIDNWDITFCALAAILVFLVIVSTFYDFVGTEECKNDKKPEISTFQKYVLAFSARKNLLDLPKADESNPHLSILYGMKTVSIFMIIMDHRFGTYISGPISNFDFIENEYRSKWAALLFHGDLFVDSFFVLSGLLVMYSLLIHFEKRFINPGYIIFLRYIRLTPVYAFVIFYYATVFNMGSGPLWQVVVAPEVEDCRNNWWTNLLYISNYVNDKKMCMVHSWYLPCDFHYFIIGIFIALLIKKQKKAGFAAMLVFFMLSVIIPFIMTIVYERPALLKFYPDFLVAPKTHVDYVMSYSKSHTRATPYAVGIIAGYIYYKLKDSAMKWSKVVSHSLTILSVILLISGLIGGAVFYDPYHEYNAIESAAYAAFHRVAWAVGTVGLLITCSYGHATFLKTVLSWSPWIPLSKLVYAAYLIHMQFQLRYAAGTRNPQFLTYFNVICLALGDIILAFGSGLILYLCVESPVRKIFKYLLMSEKHSPKTTETALQDNVIHNNNSFSNPDHNSRL